jgi:hypothetical protein
MFAKSPGNGVTMRQRHSSLITDTQVPVRSTGAASRAVCCGSCRGGPWVKPSAGYMSSTAALAL